MHFDRECFVYLVGWSEFDRWYIGSRYGRHSHPSQLWVSYFTSSTAVKKFRFLHGEPDVITIIRCHKDKTSALKHEHRLLTYFDVVFNPRFLNAGIAQYPKRVKPEIKQLKKTTRSLADPDKPVILPSQFKRSRKSSKRLKTEDEAILFKRLAAGDIRSTNTTKEELRLLGQRQPVEERCPHCGHKGLFGFLRDHERFCSGQAVHGSLNHVPPVPANKPLSAAECKTKKELKAFRAANRKAARDRQIAINLQGTMARALKRQEEGRAKKKS